MGVSSESQLQMDLTSMPQDNPATVPDDHARAQDCQLPKEQHMPEISVRAGEHVQSDQAMQEKTQLQEVCRGYIHILTVHGFR